MSRKPEPYPKDPRFLVFENGSVLTPRGKHTFGYIEKTTGRRTVCTTLNGVKKHYPIHRMVLETFKGEPKEGQVGSHLNGNKLDNHFTNLTWETQKENCARKKQHSTAQVGEKNPAAKLTWKKVKCIRTSILSNKELGEIFSVSTKHVERIRRGVTWQ